MDIIALIPARGGSKGIKRKNLAIIDGLPLVAFPIITALQSKYIQRVIVSTDDDEIIQVAKNFGAEIPFKRPAEFATDTATDLQVFKHCIEWFAINEGTIPKLVVQLRPTVPLRDVKLIDRAIELMLSRPDVTSLRSVSSPDFSPYKMWKINNNNILQPLINIKNVKDFYDKPRQVLPNVFAQDGYVDIVRTDTILKGSMAGEKILAFTEHGKSYDIDEYHQLERIKKLIEIDFSDLKSRTEMASLNLGIIQGRLSETAPDVLQQFPADWKKEFLVAKELGLKYIELLVERKYNSENPLYSTQGLGDIKSISNQTGVKTNLVCVDIFIENDFEKCYNDLVKLIPNFSSIGIEKIILPLFNNSVLNSKSIQRYKKPLFYCSKIAQKFNMEICIESPLTADELLVFLNDLNAPNLKVCYDTGNTSFLRHNIVNDILKLGPLITHVHVKDKTYSGDNVLLGYGNTQIANAMSSLLEIDFKGGLTFETHRGDDPVLTATHNMQFLKTILKNNLKERSVII